MHRARHVLEAFFADAVPDDVVQVAVLLTSELVTNAVHHARSPFTISAALLPGGVRVEVEDASPTPPELCHPDSTSMSGRGVLMVDLLSARWGSEPTADGKRTWFELDTPTTT